MVIKIAQDIVVQLLGSFFNTQANLVVVEVVQLPLFADPLDNGNLLLGLVGLACLEVLGVPQLFSNG